MSKWIFTKKVRLAGDRHVSFGKHDDGRLIAVQDSGAVTVFPPDPIVHPHTMFPGSVVTSEPDTETAFIENAVKLVLGASDYRDLAPETSASTPEIGEETVEPGGAGGEARVVEHGSGGTVREADVGEASKDGNESAQSILDTLAASPGMPEQNTEMTGTPETGPSDESEDDKEESGKGKEKGDDHHS